MEGRCDSDPDDPTLTIAPRGQSTRKKHEDRAPIKLFFTKPADNTDVRYYKVCQKSQESNPGHAVATYAYSTGNSGLKHHLQTRHPRAFKQCLEIETSLGQGGLLGKQGTLDGHVVKTAPKLPFSRERLTGALVKLISACDLPFTLVEQPEFVDVIRLLKFDILDEDIPGRKAMVSALMKEYELEKESLKDCLKAIPGDELNGSHSGSNLAQYVIDCLIELGIEKKLGWITTDNATNNDTMVLNIELKLREKGIRWDSDTRHIQYFSVDISHLNIMHAPYI
ncbi:hypothetical protein M422DRAFT_44546 [Sphaerobolus stellatus SS14]|nr:hypothetical protein M422DRAFT_44546 [Sphaerobolus stellatus SS14]